jgi:hypothetical protein
MVGKQNKSRFLQKKRGKILTLDLDTLEYRAAKSFFATLELTKTIDKPSIDLKF